MKFEHRRLAALDADAGLLGQAPEFGDGIAGDGGLYVPAARGHGGVVARGIERVHGLARRSVMGDGVLWNLVEFHAGTTRRQTKAIEKRPLSGT